MMYRYMYVYVLAFDVLLCSWLKFDADKLDRRGQIKPMRMNIHVAWVVGPV